MMDCDEEVDFVGFLGDLSLESEPEPALSESASLHRLLMLRQDDEWTLEIPPMFGFFFVWMLHGSTSPLSGRSPFCQLQISEKVAKTLDVKYQVKQQIQKQKRKNTNHKAVSQRVQGEGEGGLFLGRLDQGLIGNAESTHVIFVPK